MEEQQPSHATRGLLHVPHDLPEPLEAVRSSVIGAVAALQLPADLDIFMRISAPGLTPIEVLSMFLDCITEHTGLNRVDHTQLQTRLSGLLLACHDSAGTRSIAGGSEDVWNISKLTEGLSRGLKVYEQDANFPTWRKGAELTGLACPRRTLCQ